MDKKLDIKWGIIGLVIFVVLLGYLNFLLKEDYISFPSSFPLLFKPLPSQSPVVPGLKTIAKFSSEQDFKEYLQKIGEEREISFDMGVKFGIGFGPRMTPMVEIMEQKMMEQEVGVKKDTAMPERVSETTVQVVGIDEPDIVKTDGREIYFSRNYQWGFREKCIGSRCISPFIEKSETTIIKAFPPTDLNIDNKIDKAGELLLNKNILVIFSGQEIFGYDVSDPKSPEKKWNLKLEDNNFVVTSRLYQNKIYLVSKSFINEQRPCPIFPLTIKGVSLEIKCQDIYHPIIPVPVDSAFIVMILDPTEGKIEKTVSFVGSSGDSVVYMSEKGIYITYSYHESIIKFFSGFLKENQDIFPKWLNEKIEKLEKYDLSQDTKLLELQFLFERYKNSLNNDERIRTGNEIDNRMSDYHKKHNRELEKTGIIKIGLEEFKIIAAGEAPGYPLNQFALDEYRENLRIATTIGERWVGIFMNGISGLQGSIQESVNDVYVLDSDLKILGSVKDMGKGEKIYSARFIEDKGYLVTFRQTDPFYVLDLLNPQNPQLKGELKIPGYSSYLHPITKDKILGIGKENWQVKISLFDVSNSANPLEVDKYILDEEWSEALSNHHAFLLDVKHQIFFLPGSKGGYIFSCKNDKLNLIKTIEQSWVKRAIYLDDYLYIISDDIITVFNELNWEKVKEIDLLYD